MGNGDLNRLAIEFLGEPDRVADRCLGFAGKTENEVSVYDEAKGLAVPDKGACSLDGCALLDVLENLGIPGFKTDDEQPAPGFLHRLECFIVGGDPGVAGPGEAKGFEFFAKLDSASVLDIEGIVIEEEFLDPWEQFFRLLHLCHDIVGGALSPSVARESLRPEAEGALCGTAARGVKRDERVHEERNAVLGDVQIAVVDLSGPRQVIELLGGKLGTIGIMLDHAV